VGLKLQQRPYRYYLPNKLREIAAVDDSLKAVFRQLVSGKLKWPLFLHGQPGCGKTCAALALLDHLPSCQQMYVTATEITSMVMARFGQSDQFSWRKFGEYRDDGPFPSGSPKNPSGSALVVLDELGVRESIKDTHYECVQRVLEDRECLPLILISNLDIAGIGKVYDARIASRCEAGTVVNLVGKDRRILS
jgi:DNA replication protein DnaC